MYLRNMKRIVLFAAAVLLSSALFAQGKSYVYTEASSLTLGGKLFTDIPNPYHRVDTVRFKGFTSGENLQVRESSGIYCLFKTNSKSIKVKTVYGTPTFPNNTMGIAARGYDLYIKDGRNWLWAGQGVPKNTDGEVSCNIVVNMDGSMHECLLYLPLFSEVNSVKVGVEEGSTLEPIDNPFRHRVAIFGSSYTHGASCSRSGMTYPAQFTRKTGIQLLSLGCSGNSKLQTYFCDVLCNAEDIDAFVFDAFSNPLAPMIEERLFPFIEKLQAAQPGKPLIFQQTIRRESRNFNTDSEAKEAAKQAMADSLMKIACKKYKDVYFIKTNATAPSHEATVDGTHPDDYGYTLWEKSIEKKLKRILAKYGIR